MRCFACMSMHSQYVGQRGVRNDIATIMQQVGLARASL
jgi:hypothetical protein